MPFLRSINSVRALKEKRTRLLSGGNNAAHHVALVAAQVLFGVRAQAAVNIAVLSADQIPAQ